MPTRVPHNYGQLAVLSSAQAREVVRAEAFPGGDTGSDEIKNAGLFGTLVGGGIGAVLGGIAGFLVGGPIGALIGAGIGGAVGGLIGSQVPTLTLSNDSYTDSATESHKNIEFNAGVPLGSSPTDYAIVNWLQGSELKPDTTPFKVNMYGATVDFNFPAWQVDSVDTDPAYWSSPGSRWNYTLSTGGFTATDDPGPALNTEKGAVYAVHFRTGLYKMADLPLVTAGGVGAAKSLSESSWDYSVRVDPVSGAFTHPSI